MMHRYMLFSFILIVTPPVFHGRPSEFGAVYESEFSSDSDGESDNDSDKNVQAGSRCPPPVSEFVSLNDVPYQDKGGWVPTLQARKVKQALVANIRLENNQFYSAPKCSVLEDGAGDYRFFGVREELHPETFSRGGECQVYLAQVSPTLASASSTNLTILVIAQRTPGLNTHCQVKVSVKVNFKLEFCSKRDWDICGQVRRVLHNPVEPQEEGEGTSEFDTEFSVETFIEPRIIEDEEENEVDNETEVDDERKEVSLVDNILIVTFSEENKPITFSVLAVLGLGMIVGIICLCCKCSSLSSKSKVSRTSSISSVSRTTLSARSSVGVQTDPMSMEMVETGDRYQSESKETALERKESKSVFDDSLVMYFNKNTEQNEYFSDEILITDNKKKNSLRLPDFDLKEKSLESLEWLKNKVKTTVDDGMDSMDWMKNKVLQLSSEETAEEVTIPPRTKKKNFERFDILY